MIFRALRVLRGSAVFIVCAATAAYAGQAELPFAIEGPPPPVLPERIARDDAGRATIRAIRLSEPLRVDGRLDEMVYERERAVSDFIQTEPLEGSPATEKTELWIMFDRDNGQTYGLQAERLVIGEHFNPEGGFVRRADIRKSYVQGRYSPYPTSLGSIRRLAFTGSIGYVENGAGRREARDIDGDLTIDFDTADRLSVGYSSSYEFVPRPFRIATGVTLPMGGYDYGSANIAFQAGQQRRFNGRLALEHGSFYGGTKTTASLSTGRATLTRSDSGILFLRSNTA